MTSTLDSLKEHRTKHAAFDRWRNDTLKPVTIHHYKDQNDIHRIVTDFRKRYRVMPGYCYTNAARLTRLYPEIRYVSGYNRCSQPHAWNSYQGLHFDITNHVATRLISQRKGITFDPAKVNFELFSITRRELQRLAAITCRDDDYHFEYWQHFIMKLPLRGFEPL